jgi:hypothetical protein
MILFRNQKWRETEPQTVHAVRLDEGDKASFDLETE